jgi:hypothetical protein
MSSRVSGRVVRKKWGAGTILALCLWVTGGCSKSQKAGDIVMDDSVPSDQAELLVADLGKLNFSFPDTYGQDIMDISDFQSATMRAWLNERISRVVGESFQADLGVVRSGQRYSSLGFAAGLDANSNVKTVMSNLGGAIYLQGKSEQTLYSVELGGQSVTVDTPRVGIIKIGEGLFTVNRVKSSDLSAPVNSYLRLATLFHEARHSDGSGSDVAMPHVKCPSGDYAGSYACDTRTNGPYEVGKLMLQRFASACKSFQECSEAEQRSMEATIADYDTRTLQGAQKANSQPEKVSE